MGENKKTVADSNVGQLFYLSLDELMTSLGVSEHIIIEIIDEGIIQVGKNEQEEWVFDSEALRSIRTVLQLKKRSKS